MQPLGSQARNEEETIRQQMAQFFELTSDGIQFLNRDYVITFMNARARAILSPSGDVVGKNIWQSFPEATRPDLPYFESYTRTMNERVATEFEAFYPAPLNIWFHIQAYPSDDGIIVFFRDITEERRKHEEFQQKSEEAERQRAEIESLYRTAPIGLAMFDLDDYHYLRLNDRQAAFFGLKPEQIVGRTLTEMAPIPGLRELFDGVAAGTPVVNFPLEGTLINDPTEHRYWTVSYYPVYASDGTITGITAASLEITAQKKAEQALIESDKLAAVGRLAASIAHEINNPLESVTNLMYLAKTSEDLTESRSYLDTADRELERVALITSQTLRFHKQSTSPQAIRGEQLITSVLYLFQGRIVSAAVEVDQRYRDCKPVRCFEGEIRQVLSNLVGNALDAMEPGGRLLVRSREGTDWTTGERGAVLTVADTGTGMSAETLAKVFKPFFTTKGLVGTGLGLWIITEILQRHGGSVQVRSKIGAGTVFSIFLPYDAVLRQSADA